MHLQIAERIMTEPVLPRATRQLLTTSWPAFYFGNVAPDFQAVCGLPRETTHFYGTPPQPDEEAYEVMLRQYPELARVGEMSPTRMAFVAGYCVHLLFDVCWFREILVPFFLEPSYWQDNGQRFLSHNVLLIYLDRVALNSLSVDAGIDLAAAEPDHWLPFAGDDQLRLWRDNIVPQLRPRARVQTIDVYAQRMRLDPATFAAHLQDPDWMAEHLFNKVPLYEVQGVLDRCRQRSLSLLTNYLAQPARQPLP